MSGLLLIIVVIGAHALALISPGPDFIMCIRNSLMYGRRAGVFTAVGFGLGIAVHIMYCLLGLAAIISKSIIVFNIIKILGAIYLAWIGYQSICTKSKEAKIDTDCIVCEKISDIKALKIGFLTNVLNPKASLFFLMLFIAFFSPQTPHYIVLIASVIMVINTMLWFTLVAILMTRPEIRDIFIKFKNVFNKIFGVLLIALGVKVALSTK